MRSSFVLLFFVIACLGTATAQSGRPRARDLGLAPGVFPPGPLNAITDVIGVKVGHVTLVEGERVRTGVTAIVPHGGNIFQEKVGGAVFVGNAFGKLAGSTQIEELGTIETPIVLTTTLSVGTAVEGLVRYTIAQPGNENVRSVNAVVGETNDGGLNDIRGLHVRPEHVIEAIRHATTGAVAEGSVGAGTGTRAYGWKGGIGTASRRLPERYGGYTLGVLVQTNFGGVLTIGGAPVGKELGRYSFSPASPADDGAGSSIEQARDPQDDLGAGSCMIVVATDAPVDARDLKRIAARALFGLGRTGSSYGNGSGDFAIAFTTSPELRQRFGDSKPAPRTILPPDGVSPLFQAALEATEVAVYNSLFQATTVTSGKTTAEAIPIERVREILKKYGVVR
ncbi:MAG: P1 family peptidase [Acidobacteria bacterium]|nr:P1 family peptidase [Acidobacteriota bacterium]